MDAAPGPTDENWDLDTLTEGVWAAIPILRAMGLRLVELGRGHVTAELPPEPNVNHVGSMYAGSLFSLGEVLGGLIGLASFDPSAYFPLVTAVHVEFLRPATGRIRAAASLSEDTIRRVLTETDQNGRAAFQLDAELTDTAGTVVATTHGDYQLRRF